MTCLQTLPFGAATFHFDPCGNQPTRIEFRLPSLRLALVERTQSLEGSEWERAGFYFLMGAGSESGGYRIYVGMSPSGVATRIKQHVKTKDWWDRALVIVADRQDGFQSSEVAWFEAAFVERLRRNAGQAVANKVQPVEATLPSWHERELEAQTIPIEAVLRLLGVLTYSSDPEIIEEEFDYTSSNTVENTSDGLTWLECALKVLSVDGRALHVSEIVNIIRESKLRDMAGAKTPEATLRRDLRQNALSENPKVEQTAPSTFRIKISSQ